MGIIISKEVELYRKYVKKRLNTKRYKHSLGVCYTAAALAMCYDTDINKAMIAGILHDNAKGYEYKILIKKCLAEGIEVSDIEMNSPELLHSKYGAYIAKKELGISDEDIINSIYYHTTGRPDMSLLEKIIFISDYIEPNRSNLPDIDYIRKISFKNIDEAISIVCKNTISHLEHINSPIDKATLDTYNYYKIS